MASVTVGEGGLDVFRYGNRYYVAVDDLLDVFDELVEKSEGAVEHAGMVSVRNCMNGMLNPARAVPQPSALSKWWGRRRAR